MLEIERQNREPADGATGSGGSDSAGASGSAGVSSAVGVSSSGTPSSAADNDSKGSGPARRTRRAVTRPAGPPAEAPPAPTSGVPGSADSAGEPDPGNSGAADSAGRAGRRRTSSRTRAKSPNPAAEHGAGAQQADLPEAGPHDVGQRGDSGGPPAPPGPVAFQPPLVIFQAPEIPPTRATPTHKPVERSLDDDADDGGDGDGGDGRDDSAQGGGSRRRRRGGRGRGRSGTGADGTESTAGAAADDQPEPDSAVKHGPEADESDTDDEGAQGSGSAKRRRRRRRSGAAVDADQPSAAVSGDDPPNTVTHVRTPREKAAELTDVRAIKGSTRLEAKRQRRREGRESGRRRPPIITESEFLARREAVERVMVVRQRADRTQIAVLEDGVLVEHYVDKASHQSYVGNVYLGKVQNVLPSMEAAFVDIGKGRNAVLYAGEVNFDASGLEGESKRIESALKSGQSILVQVTKDPIGHKGARLTSQVSLPGRYLVYVPGASMTGISRKLPDTERTRLKQILKQVMPEHAGVIVRTAAEGASEEELARDVARLAAQWEAIEKKAKTASAPDLLYSEPDLTLRVVRDIFNEDFSSLVIASDSEWDLVDEYVRYVAPHLADRMQRWDSDKDVFTDYRIDEQLAKALERKVWLPSGGSLVIDHTEAMTVIDVNTGKFTGQGGNLEQTVTRNNLEAAEEIVRQLRLRDLGGIIVIDFIDMVLESNRELVLRRLLECLARDRTKHQVAEVTSLGLVQMTRKRVGSGLLEAFSVPCEHCNGRGVIISLEPVDHSHGRDSAGQDSGSRDGASQEGAGKGSRAGRGRSGSRAGRAPSPGNAGRVAIAGPAADGARQDTSIEGAPDQDTAAQGMTGQVVADLADAQPDGSSPDASVAAGTVPHDAALATEPGGSGPDGGEASGPDKADLELAGQDGASADGAPKSSGGGRFGRSRSGRGRRSGARGHDAAAAEPQAAPASEHQAGPEHQAPGEHGAAQGHDAVEPANS